MLHPGYIERDSVLDACPDFWCRRARTCRATAEARCPHPCLRTHEDLDTFRFRLAAKLDAFVAEYRRDPAPPPLSTHELELRLKYLKDLLEEGDRAASTGSAAARPPR